MNFVDFAFEVNKPIANILSYFSLNKKNALTIYKVYN